MEKIKKMISKKKFIYTVRTMLIVLTASIVCIILKNVGVEKENVLMVFMVGVLIISTCTQGYEYGIAGAVVSVMMFNYFFTVPVHTFAIMNPNDVALMGFFLIAAVISSSLTVRFQKQMLISKKNEEAARQLYEMSERFINVTGKENIIELGIGYIYEHTGYESVVELLGEEARADAAKEYMSKDYVMFPIIGIVKQIGILKVFNHNQGFTVEQDLLVKTAANQIGIALDRELIYAEQERTKVEMEREHMKSSMLRSISHDFRTPLTGILGDCSLIIDSEEMDREEEKQLLKDIMEQSMWLRKLVVNILNMTKIESGQQFVEKSKEVIDDVINEAERHVIGLGQRDFRVVLPKQVIMAEIDGKMIMQVLVNILDNAVKHTLEGGKIILTASFRRKRVYVSIEDAGPGIEEGMEEQIFDEFVSLSGESMDQKRGIGLGLAICRQVIRAHGGEIWAENRSGGGARFVFWLPAEQADEL